MKELIEKIIILNKNYESSENNSDEQHDIFINLLKGISNLSSNMSKELPNLFITKCFNENMIIEFINKKNKDNEDKFYDIIEILIEKNHTDNNPFKFGHENTLFYGIINNHRYICIDTNLRNYILFEDNLFYPYRYYLDLPKEEQKLYNNWQIAVENARYLSSFSDNNRNNKAVYRPNLSYFKVQAEKEYLDFPYSIESLIKMIMTPNSIDNYTEINLYFEAIKDIFKSFEK